MGRPTHPRAFTDRAWRRRRRRPRALSAALHVPDLLAVLCGGLLPCPGCGVRSAGTQGLCPRCRRAGHRPGSAASLAWLGPYAGPLGRAVRALKYRGATRAARWLGVSLAASVRAAGWRPDLVCAVPLHASRLGRRGYNQAVLIGRPLAGALAVPFVAGLTRTRETAPQARLGRGRRAANVAGAFRAHGAAVAGRSVLLVDDVLTTGATARACRAALLAGGAREVRVAVVAYAERAGLVATQNETSMAVPMPTSAPTSTCG